MAHWANYTTAVRSANGVPCGVSSVLSQSRTDLDEKHRVACGWMVNGSMSTGVTVLERKRS